MNNDFNQNEQNNEFNQNEQNNELVQNDHSNDSKENGEFDQSNTTYVQNPVVDKNGQTAQTLGIIAIISSIVCCPLVGFILALISLSYVKKSKAAMGMETSEAHTGRICSIIAIVVFGVQTIVAIITLVIYIAAIAAAVVEANMAY